MSLFAISDLHLSTDEKTNKSMEVFGRRWDHYTERLEANWRRLITDGDTVVIPGDVSWALSLEESLSDMKFLASLPGKKILGKGNHDFWWATMKKHEDFLNANGIEGISFLFNNAIETEDFILAGTRGWFVDEDATGVPDNTDFEKIARREEMRLAMSLAAAEKLKEHSPDKEIVVFLHFPPYLGGKEVPGMLSQLVEHKISRVYYGHIHGNAAMPLTEEAYGIRFHLISADHVGFLPQIIQKQV